MADRYRFFFQKANADGTASGSPIDIEASYPGVRYRSMEGLETVGKVKNTYSESYPEGQSLRLFHPSDKGLDPVYDTTTLTLSLCMLGDGRRDALAELRKLLYSGRLYYWDTARNRKAYVVLTAEQEVEKDTLKGMKIITCNFKLTNLWGIAKKCDNEGKLI